MPGEQEYMEVRVRDILDEMKSRRQPSVVKKDALLRDGVEAMIANPETRKAYVVDEDGKLMGTLTLETLMRHTGYMLGVRKTGITSFMRMLGEVSKDRVTEVMIQGPRVLESELLTNVTKLMVEHHLNDLPVVDSDGRLVGELNGLDILKMSKKYWS